MAELSAYDKWKKNLGETRPWDMLNPTIVPVPKDVAQARYDICKECPFFLPTKQCSRCGCFMKAKVKLPNADCPEGKWHKFTEEIH